MRSLSPLVCLARLAVGGGMMLATSEAALAQGLPAKEVAKKLFEEGVELEKKNDFAGALAKYKDAEQITVTPGLRFHKGYCLEQTGKLNAAVQEYEAAGMLAGAANKSEIRAVAAARVEPLRARVPQISIRLVTRAKDSAVLLDGVPVGAMWLDGTAFRLDPGGHIVVARAPGYTTFTRVVQVPESVTTTVEVSLIRAPTGALVPATPDTLGTAASASAPAAPPASEPPRDVARPRSLALPITTTAAAVALAGGGVAMFLVAGGAQADAQRSCPTKATCDDERSRVRSFDGVALGAFLGAAGFAVVSVFLWTSGGPSSAGRTPTTRFVASPAGMGVAGTFW